MNIRCSPALPYVYEQNLQILFPSALCCEASMQSRSWDTNSIEFKDDPHRWDNEPRFPELAQEILPNSYSKYPLLILNGCI